MIIVMVGGETWALVPFISKDESSHSSDAWALVYLSSLQRNYRYYAKPLWFFKHNIPYYFYLQTRFFDRCWDFLSMNRMARRKILYKFFEKYQWRNESWYRRYRMRPHDVWLSNKLIDGKPVARITYFT